MARHAVSIRSADGRVTRWAPDAPPEKRPHGLKWSTAMPGGFRALDCELVRDRADGFDLRRFDDVRAYGPGNRTRWEGRQAEFPSQSDELKVSPAAEGWAAALEDRQDFRAIFVDVDPASWTETTLEERSRLVSAGAPYGVDYGVQRDQGISFTGTTGKAIPAGSRESVCYFLPPGLKVLAIQYRATQSSATNVISEIRANDARIFNAADLYTLVADGTIKTTFPNPRRNALLMMVRAGVTHTPAAANPYGLHVDLIVVFGDHSVSGDGVSGFGVSGFFGSTLIAAILRDAAPQLNYSTGDGGSIQPSSYLIPHAVFRDPVSGGTAIQQVNRYDLRPWFVWEDRTFYWHDLEKRGRTWRPRIGQGARLKLEGETSEEVWTGVVVRYRSPLGEDLTVGPPASIATATSSLLEVTDPANDAVAHNVSRVAVIDLPVITDQAGATLIGQLWLQETNAKRNRGEIILTDKVRDDQGVRDDVAAVRAGDRIEVPDRDDVTRVVISTDYDDESQQLTAALDSTPHTLDALYERLGVSLVGVVE